LELFENIVEWSSDLVVKRSTDDEMVLSLNTSKMAQLADPV
jgi:hypothetical protein